MDVKIEITYKNNTLTIKKPHYIAEYDLKKCETVLSQDVGLVCETIEIIQEANKALQDRIDEQIKLLTNILITLGITTTRAEGERLIQGGGVLKQVEKLKDRIDELEEDLDTAKANANSAFTMYQNAQDRIQELEGERDHYKNLFKKAQDKLAELLPQNTTYRNALEEILTLQHSTAISVIVNCALHPDKYERSTEREYVLINKDAKTLEGGE